MPAAPSIEKRKTFVANQDPILSEILAEARSQKLKIVDGNETVIISWASSPFRAFVSRISKSIQFYQLGDGHNQFIGKLSDYDTAQDFFMDAADYKTRLESGEVVRTFVLSPDEDEEPKYNPGPATKDSEYVVINVKTNQSHILKGKQAVEKFLSCSRVSIDSVLNGKAHQTKGHYIKRIV